MPATTETMQPTEQIHPLALQRCRRCVEIMEPLEQLLTEYLSTSFTMPSPALFDHVEQLMAVAGSDSTIPFPITTWPFCDRIVELAKSILSNLADWRETFSNAQAQLLTECFGHREELLAPRPSMPIRTVRLETLEMCEQQKLSDRQIAKLYNWFLPNGDPDVSRVWDARDGKVEPPVTHTFRPTLGRMPHLGLLDTLLTHLQYQGMNEDEAALAEAIAEKASIETETTTVNDARPKRGSRGCRSQDADAAARCQTPASPAAQATYDDDVDDVNAAFDDVSTAPDEPA